MKSWLKENWFKVSLLIIILILGIAVVGVSYYILVKTPQQKWFIERKSECKRLAKNYAEEQERIQADVIFTATTLEVTYDKQREKCFAAIKFFLSKQTQYEYHLIDPESEEEFAVYWYDYKSEEIFGDWNIYKNIYTNVFMVSPSEKQ